MILLSQFLGFLNAGFCLLDSQDRNNKLLYEVDHIDRNIYNNNINNLRVVSVSENQKNKSNKGKCKDKEEAKQREIEYFNNNIIDPILRIIFGYQKWEFFKHAKTSLFDCNKSTTLIFLTLIR